MDKQLIVDRYYLSRHALVEVNSCDECRAKGYDKFILEPEDGRNLTVIKGCLICSNPHLKREFGMNRYDDYDDICYECTGYGDDYYIDENGELVSACDNCPFNGMDDD